MKNALGNCESKRLRGAKTIIGVDMNPDKVEIGKQCIFEKFLEFHKA